MSDSNLNKKLGGLPSPRSPSELDAKILSYAKEHAPQTQKSRQPLWITGMATAAIASIAVFITLPQQQAPTHSGATKEVTVPAARVLDQQNDTADTLVENRAVTKMQQREAMQKKSAPASTDMAAAAMSRPMEQEAAPRSGRTLERDMAQPTLTAAPETEQEVHHRLKRCHALLEEGDTAQAEECYHTLKARCSDCGLPETLVDALKNLH